MKKNISIYVQLLVLAISTTAFVACGGRSDEDLKESITEKLSTNQEFSNISAEVNNGVVTLTGNCETNDCDKQVAQAVKEVDGVDSVNNQVQSSQSVDLTLRTSVQSIISRYEGVQADVAGGMVVLRGSIKKDQVQPLMNELEALQPKKIDNQLAVQ